MYYLVPTSNLIQIADEMRLIPNLPIAGKENPWASRDVIFIANYFFNTPYDKVKKDTTMPILGHFCF